MIYVMSEEGAYKIDKETFKTDESWSIYLIDFIIPPTEGKIVDYVSLNSGSVAGSLVNFCVSNNGNAYAQVLGAAGAAFEYPINTSMRGGTPGI